MNVKGFGESENSQRVQQTFLYRAISQTAVMILLIEHTIRVGINLIRQHTESDVFVVVVWINCALGKVCNYSLIQTYCNHTQWNGFFIYGFDFWNTLKKQHINIVLPLITLCMWLFDFKKILMEKIHILFNCIQIYTDWKKRMNMCFETVAYHKNYVWNMPLWFSKRMEFNCS